MTLIMVTAGRCQFCHRTAGDVAHILAGDSSFICNECVQKCTAMLASTGPPESTATVPVTRYVFQRLVQHFAPRRANEVQTTSRTFPIRQQADLQRALDALLGERRVPENFLGFQAGYRHDGVSYPRLARGLPLSDSLIPELAARTDGASPAFIKELLRRMAQHHLEAGNPDEVSRATADSALHEMLFSGGILNKRLLGGEAVADADD